MADLQPPPEVAEIKGGLKSVATQRDRQVGETRGVSLCVFFVLKVVIEISAISTYLKQKKYGLVEYGLNYFVDHHLGSFFNGTIQVRIGMFFRESITSHCLMPWCVSTRDVAMDTCAIGMRMRPPMLKIN